MQKFPRIHAHRGLAELAPENTLSAFQLAVENGVDGIEFDIHYTKDNKIVVHHDYYLGRTSNGSGLISEKSFDELLSLDFGSWFDEKYKGERIPLFSEVLTLLKDKCRLEIQLASLNKQFIFDVISILEHNNMIDQVEITSSYPHALMKVRELHPKIAIGVFLPSEGWMLDDLWSLHSIQTMDLIGANVAHIPNNRLNEHNISRIKKSGYLVHAADCNEINHLKAAISYKVDQLSTDKVLQAVQHVRELDIR